MDKLAISWQNFAQVGLQLKFAFRIRPKMSKSNFKKLSYSTVFVSPKPLYMVLLRRLQ